MSDGHQLFVKLTGDRSGRYVVVRENPDGSLLIAPDPRVVPNRPAGRDESQTGLAGLLFTSSRSTSTVREVLERWGIALLDDETITEFLMAELDGSSAYVAVTSERFISIAPTGRRHVVTQEHQLTELREARLVRRRLRQTLCVTWDHSTTVVRTSDRETLTRLHRRLTGAVE